ncbi:unknown [Paraprevotella clara CAG:116]|nr:unknown [Paraprevotella clara CAG:116]
MPRFDVLWRKPMTLWYKAESPTPAVLSKTAASLLRTTLTSIVSTCMPPRKPVYFTMWS